jgi:hypothetical protein
MSRREANRIAPETLALVVDLLPTALSLRDIGAITGLRLDVVRRQAAPFLAIMKLQGTHPKCACGKDRFHPYGCINTYSKADRTLPVPGCRPAEAAIFAARRAAVIEMILTGATYPAIDAAFGMGRGSAKSHKRFMTPEQYRLRKEAEAKRILAEKAETATRQRARAERNNAQRKRKWAAEAPARAARAAARAAEKLAAKRQKDAQDKAISRPFSDPVYARIASAVPRWVSPSLREDVISEIYIAVIDGEMSVDAIEANATRFTNAAVGQFESKWGPRPLDMPMFNDGHRTLADVIPDPSALAAFGRLDSLQLGRRRRAA